MKITVVGHKACLILESHEDIRRASRIWNDGINCKSDRGADVELIGDQLREAAKKECL